MKLTPGFVFVGVALVGVLAALVAGFLAIGSPTDERARRIDGRRVEDLQGIAAAADLYWTRHARLPADLDELGAEPGVQINSADPVSGEDYAYQPMDPLRYEVCADFDRESEEIAGDPEQDLWAHGSGRQCFELEAEEVTRRDRSRDPGR